MVLTILLQSLAAHRPRLNLFRLFSTQSSPSPSPAYNSNNTEAVTHTLPFPLPRRKHRTELSVLKALSSCVGRDPTNFQFHNVDDPYFAFRRRERLQQLSRASGILAARFMVRQMPKVFANLVDEQPCVARWVPQRSPESVLKQVEKGQRSPGEGLKLLMLLQATEQAWNLYRDHKETLQSDTHLQHELLDLLCATNSTNLSDEVPSHETYFAAEMEEFLIDRGKHGPLAIPEEARKTGTGDQRKTEDKSVVWRREGYAEMLFQEMGTRDFSAYRSMIRGAAKYLNAERAFELAGQLPPSSIDLEICNCLLRVAHCLPNDDSAVVWTSMVSLLQQMSNHSVQPDVHTFNNVLYSLANCAPSTSSVSNGLAVVKEMLSLNLAPNLGTYANLLEIFHCSPVSYDLFPYLHGMLDALEARRDQIQWEDVESVDDLWFFLRAMKIAASAGNLPLVYRVDHLLNSGGREHLFANSLVRQDYARQLLTVVVNREPNIDRLMDYYAALRSFVLSFPIVRIKLADRITREASSHYAARLLIDSTDYLDFGRSLPKFMKILLTFLAEVSTTSPVEHREPCLQSSSALYRKVLRITDSVPLEPDLLSQLTQMCLNFDDLVGARQWIDYANEHRILLRSQVVDLMLLVWNRERGNAAERLWELAEILVGVGEVSGSVRDDDFTRLLPLLEAVREQERLSDKQRVLMEKLMSSANDLSSSSSSSSSDED